ncbi:MAG: copper amine oxidase N-terminal domain-containing protein [Anaerotignaceae bacterium]
MKKFLATCMAVSLVTGSLATTAIASTIGVSLMDTKIEFSDAAPFVDESSRTLVPLRAIGDAMELNVTWHDDTKKAVFKKTFTEADGILSEDGEAFVGAFEVEFTIGSKIAKTITYYYPLGTEEISETSTFTESEIEMDTAAVIVDGRTFAPVRYLAEQFGYTVSWDAETSTVVITLDTVETTEDTTTEKTEGTTTEKTEDTTTEKTEDTTTEKTEDTTTEKTEDTTTEKTEGTTTQQ